MFTFNILKSIKNKIFPFYKNRDLKFVFNKLKKDSNDQKVAMFVGGCVRKYLQNQKIDDIDVATVLTPEQIKDKLKDTDCSIIDSGLKHGTITIIKNNLKLEFTTLRKDIKTYGRQADIEHTTDWSKDSERRDFTINAIYLDMNGNIFDPQFGTRDLKNRNVKFIGDPNKRIEEDYLRIIRLIRFSLEYENEIEPNTLKAVKLNLDGIKKISKERILMELIKILKTKNFEKINNYRNILEIFLLIFPEFKNFKRLIKLNNINYNVDLKKEILLAILLIDETNNHEYFSHKYSISNDLKNYLNLMFKNFWIMKKDNRYFNEDLKKNIYFFGKHHLNDLITLNFFNNKKMKLDQYLKILNKIKNLDIPKLNFDGKFLIDNGMKEGAPVGKTLKVIENEWINNDFKISEQRVLEIIKSSQI